MRLKKRYIVLFASIFISVYIWIGCTDNSSNPTNNGIPADVYADVFIERFGDSFGLMANAGGNGIIEARLVTPNNDTLLLINYWKGSGHLRYITKHIEMSDTLPDPGIYMFILNYSHDSSIILTDFLSSDTLASWFGLYHSMSHTRYDRISFAWGNVYGANAYRIKLSDSLGIYSSPIFISDFIAQIDTNLYNYYFRYSPDDSNWRYLPESGDSFWYSVIAYRFELGRIEDENEIQMISRYSKGMTW